MTKHIYKTKPDQPLAKPKSDWSYSIAHKASYLDSWVQSCYNVTSVETPRRDAIMYVPWAAAFLFHKANEGDIHNSFGLYYCVC